jgi:tetratricopeptide (TPR) repeat protein
LAVPGPTSQNEPGAAAKGGQAGVAQPAKASGGRRRKIAVLLICLPAITLAAWLPVKSWLIPRIAAWYHAHAARTELKNYHNPQALQHLKECRKVWPEDPDLLLLAARAERRALHYTEAERLLDEYRKARGLNKAYSFEQLLLAAERNVDRVAERCRRSLEQDDEDSVLILEALTRGYFRQYQPGAARWCLDRWLEMEPNNAQVHYLDGQFQMNFTHKQDAALASYRRAVELDPEHEEARVCLAVLLLDPRDKTDAEEALKHFEFVADRRADNPGVQIGMAEAYNILGQPEKAIKIADAVLAEKPDHLQALSLRGRLALDQGQYEAAESWLRETLAVDPNIAGARHLLVQCLRHNNKTDEAARLEQESKQIQEDIVRSDEIITHDLPKSPHSAALQCELGKLMLRRGRVEEGLRWLESALHEDPQYTPALDALAEYRKKGQGKPK